ncbi:short-chain dehydrogenase/reductase [Xylariaceae sp. FL1019]|nr:short-chain dehydrogenase/reductase [Xylariaceae sp. FL1019]
MSTRNIMSATNTITASETRPGGPPADLHVRPMNTKVRWATKNPPADPKVSFAGKNVLVTGANTGLGYQAALKYASLGADRLFIGVRTKAKGEQTKQRIIKATNCTEIEILTVDLVSFESVQSFVEELRKSTNDKLDVALLNAGMGNPNFQRSPSGWEMTVQVNVLSTALMAVLLLPLLRATAARGGSVPHLTFVNSHGHDTVKREWLGPDGSLLQATNTEKGWVSENSYSMVKLEGMAIMQHIAQVAAGSGGPTSPDIIVNAVCPDLCRTELGRNYGTVQRIIGNIVISLIARTAEQGSRTLVSGTALGPESHGRFWHHDVLYPIGEMAKDEILMKRTWDEIWEVISKDRPELEKALNGE